MAASRPLWLSRVVLEAADLIAALGLVSGIGAGGDEPPEPPPGLTGDLARVWRELAEGGEGDAEGLARRTGLTAAALLKTLSLLEVAGHIRRDREGYDLAHSSGP